MSKCVLRKINAENKAKISMAGAKHVPVAGVATSKPGLRPRTALGDIGNKVSEQPQAKLPLKKVDTPSPSPMETSGCAPAEEYLCQAFSDVILAVSDVDAEDGADPNLCSEYVKDIYAYLRQLEEEQAVKPKYLMGREVTGNMRAILIDWLVQVQMKFRLLQENMYMTVPKLIGSCRIIVCPRRCCSWLKSLPCLLQANMRKRTLQKSVTLPL